MVTAADRTHLHQDLRRHLGERAASTLMELLPMTPVDELVTHRDLELSVEALRHELKGETAELRGEVRGLNHRMDGMNDRLDGMNDRLDALQPRIAMTIVGTLALLSGLVGGAMAIFG